MAYTDDLLGFTCAGLRPLLTRLIASPEELGRVASRSYAHDNGFTKIVLVSGRESGNALRMHVWPGGSADEGNIHNHCWDFRSVVLSGQLEFEEFSVDRDGPVSAVHYAYAPSTDFEYELRPFGTTGLRSTTRGSRRVGELYDMSAETLHRTWGCAATTTVTLLAQGKHRRRHADVFVTRPGGVPTEARNVPLTSEDVRSLIAGVLDSDALAPA